MLRKPVRKLNTSAVAPAQRSRGVSARGIKIVRRDERSPLMGLVTKNETSTQIPDPFADFYGAGTGSNILLAPPFNPDALVRVGSQNSTLNQCIDAYIVNIESYGYTLEYIGPPGKENSKEAQSEKSRAVSFLDSPTPDRTLRDIREHSRKDYEYTGNKYFEVMRNRRGEIVGIDQVPATTMRITKVDPEPTDYEGYIRDPEDMTKWVKRKLSKYFRRYVQISPTGRRVYFKEFGDPRPIDPTTGKVNAVLAASALATEIYHKPIYVPGSPYGQPRWIGTLPSILGTRESELVNLNFFRENAIPAMAVLISGGALTAESFDNITNIIRASRGKDAMNRILILEAAADDSAGSVDGSAPAPKIEMKPMVSERQQDGLFKDFEASGARKIRSSMRLPAVYTGDTEEYTKATAEAGQRLAESQVFSPERSSFDEFVNFKVFPTKNVTMWRFKTMGPTTYDPAELAGFIDKFAKNGALSPNVLIKLANQVLDIQIPPMAEDWANIPFSIVLEALQFGYEVKGLDKYITAIQEVANTPLNDNGSGGGSAKPVKPPPAKAKQRAALKKLIRTEAAEIANDLIEAAGHNRQAA